MLSRTADHLFWMMRYLERAETTARLLEVGARSALMPDVSGGYRNDWEAVLQASGGYDDFLAKYGVTRCMEQGKMPAFVRSQHPRIMRHHRSKTGIDTQIDKTSINKEWTANTALVAGESEGGMFS